MTNVTGKMVSSDSPALAKEGISGKMLSSDSPPLDKGGVRGGSTESPIGISFNPVLTSLLLRGRNGERIPKGPPPLLREGLGQGCAQTNPLQLRGSNEERVSQDSPPLLREGSGEGCPQTCYLRTPSSFEWEGYNATLLRGKS
jgi:hypothetical protein